MLIIKIYLTLEIFSFFSFDKSSSLTKFHRFHVSRWKVLLSRVAKKILYRLFLLLFCLKQHLNCVFQSSALSPDLLGFVTGRRDEESQPDGGKKSQKNKEKVRKKQKKNEKVRKRKKNQKQNEDMKTDKIL